MKEQGQFWDYLPAILIVSAILFIMPRFKTKPIVPEKSKNQQNQIEENKKLIQKNAQNIEDIIGIMSSNERRLRDLKVQIASASNPPVIYKAPPAEISRVSINRKPEEIPVVRTVNTPQVVDPRDFQEDESPKRQSSCQRSVRHEVAPTVVVYESVPFSGCSSPTYAVQSSCSSSRVYSSNCSGGGSVYYRTSSGGCGSVGGGSEIYFAPTARSYQYAMPLQFSPFGGGT